MYKTLIMICFSLTIILIVLINQQTIPLIQYFPLSEEVKLENSTTSIEQINSEKNNEFKWSIYSNTSESLYLRQDISLLYINGYYKGVLSKWRENVSEITSNQDFIVSDNAWIQAITFHYGEIHEENDQIQSTQEMTSKQLFFMKNNHTPNLFTQPNNNSEKTFKNKITMQVNNDLSNHWKALIDHFEINEADYTTIPLTEIINYQTQTLPNKSKLETDRIIGQFWEGLYKQYIILLKEKEIEHYMPVILYANDQSHLIFLFSLGKDKYKYIQKL